MQSLNLRPPSPTINKHLPVKESSEETLSLRIPLITKTKLISMPSANGTSSPSLKYSKSSTPWRSRSSSPTQIYNKFTRWTKIKTKSFKHSFLRLFRQKNSLTWYSYYTHYTTSSLTLISLSWTPKTSSCSSPVTSLNRVTMILHLIKDIVKAF